MKSKLTEEHLKALKDAVYPMQFQKTKVGLRKTLLVREVIGVIKEDVMKPNCEIAAEQQGLIETVIPNLWVHPDTRETKTWTAIGFKKVGYMTEENYAEFTGGSIMYCSCAYPIKSEIETHWPCCRKCRKQIL
jgi:hypothetical protein